MTAAPVITAIVKPPGSWPPRTSNRFIIENILAALLIVLGPGGDVPGCDRTRLADARSKCCVKFIFIVFWHFMMTRRIVWHGRREGGSPPSSFRCLILFIHFPEHFDFDAMGNKSANGRTLGICPMRRDQQLSSGTSWGINERLRLTCFSNQLYTVAFSEASIVCSAASPVDNTN